MKEYKVITATKPNETRLDTRIVLSVLDNKYKNLFESIGIATDVNKREHILVTLLHSAN